MKLTVIVDGYNLLGVRGRGFSGGNFMTEAARERLILELSTYRQRKQHDVIVVFDGWKDGLGAEHHEARSGITVIYSRRGEQADQVIQRLAEEFGREGAVVSSDREVANAARVAGAFVMGAQEFATRLAERVGRPLSAGAAGAESGWKKDETDDRPRRPVDKKGNPKKLPKAVRARRRKLRGF